MHTVEELDSSVRGTKTSLTAMAHVHTLKVQPWSAKNATIVAVLRECSQEPLQFFWFRASIRLFKSMLDSNSETLRRVLKADLYLASFDSSCWSAQVSNAFNGLQGSAMFKMLRATQVPMQEFICDLRFRHLKVWREAKFSCPRAVNKKAVTYHKWCGRSESGPRGSPSSIPSYLYKDLGKQVLRNFSRLRVFAPSSRGSHARVHLRFAFQTFEGMVGSGKLIFHVLAQ
jgi:hypothetical protein